MASITLYIAASLDGFIATEDGSVDWLETVEDTYEEGVSGGSYDAFFDTVDCLVMGANTYEQVRSFGDWPYGDTPTFVTTHDDLPKETDSISLYEGDLRTLIDDTIPPEYDHIWLVGGAALAQQFLKQGLVNEIRLSVIPVLVGNGISLFDDADVEQALHLTETTAYKNGIVELQYEVRNP